MGDVYPIETRKRAPNRYYSKEIAEEICIRIMQKQSLTKICEDPKMPTINAVVKWLADPRRADFRELYYFARRVQAEMFIDEIIEIADHTQLDWKPRFNRNGDYIDHVPDNEAIQRSRVRIDTRKWFAAKMVPKIYGEKLNMDLDVTGDLAELLKKASNNDQGLPPPIDGQVLNKKK